MYMSPKKQKPNVAAVEPLTEKEIALIQKRYKNASESEKIFFETIFSHIRDPKILVHLFRGAHIEFADKGETYENWCNDLSKLTNRDGKSSHQSDKPQKSFQGGLVVECLFGAREKRDKMHTWFQLESHSLKATEILGHAASYVAYKLTGYNQGPYGASPHTEAKPLILTYTKSKQKREQQKNFWLKVIFEQPAKITHDTLVEYAKIHESIGHLQFKESKKSEGQQELKETKPDREPKVDDNKPSGP